MNISIFGFKFDLEILILIGIIYLILVSHTFCGSCNYSLLEAFTDASGNVAQKITTVAKGIATDISNNIIKTTIHTDASNGTIPQPAGGIVANKAKGVIAGKEGFVGANTNYGQSSPYDLTGSSGVDTSSWNQPNLTVVPGQPLNPAVQQFLSRKQQQLPLPEGEMDFFANVEFKPECCGSGGSAYSSSNGCACMTSQDFNFLKMRGSNNVPYSEY